MVSGKGHPLPGSDEARHDEIPEHLERDKGRGDDPEAAVQPADRPVEPDGTPYPSGDRGRGPGDADGDDELQMDQAAHQDRGHAQVALSPGQG